MAAEPARPDPDALLAQIKASEPKTRGELRIYLGAAPGVGKTYTMLEEAHRRCERGTDLVVGFVETHGRPLTQKLIEGLEVVPPLDIPYKGVVLHEMDTEAVIKRHPKVALVDELAHTNAPGSKHEKRYQDVMDLLDAGINVITTLNVQHIESLNDTVKAITGITVAERVPDWVVDKADQIELIDMDPHALVRRMVHGNIYPAEQAKRALENFFTVPNLTALREIALRVTAREVEDRLVQYIHEHQAPEGIALGERVMVAVDHRPIGKTLIRRGWRMAAALKADLVVVYIEPDQGGRQTQSVEDDRNLRSNLQLAEELGAKVVRLKGDVADEIVHYARSNEVAHLVLGHPSHSRWHDLFRGSVTAKVLRQLKGTDVHLIAEDSSGEESR